MLFSVIIPVYNCKDSLAGTVGSVLASGVSDFEILLIDDGSSDGTAGICDALAADHGNIRCIHQSNAGVSAARNRGIAEAAGDYILFFDADDAVDSGSLAYACDLVRQTRPDMLIFGLSFDYYFHGRLYRRDDLVCEDEGLLDGKQWRAAFEKLYTCNALSPVWNKFIRREILVERGIRFRRDMIEMEDFLFVVHCMAHCDRVYLLPEAIYRYRQAEDERSTFNRLLRIPSLTAYMQPFEEAAKTAGIEGLETVVREIYVSLFCELMHFGTTAQIAAGARDMLAGHYAAAVESAQPKLYRLLAAGKYRQVWLRGAKLRLRHALAVRVKYARNCWRNR